MPMTSSITRGLVLPFVLLGLLAAASLASAAEWTDHSGTICKNYNASEVTFIDYFPNGTRNLRTGPTSVICPLTRNTTGTFGAYFYIGVTHFGSQTTTCSAYSYHLNGAYACSGSGSYTGGGNGLIGISLYGSGCSDALSNYSIFCTIPGNGNGIVNAVNFYEY